VEEIVRSPPEVVIDPVNGWHHAVHHCEREITAGIKAIHVRNMPVDETRGTAVDQQSAHVAVKIHVAYRDVMDTVFVSQVVELAV